VVPVWCAVLPLRTAGNSREGVSQYRLTVGATASCGSRNLGDSDSLYFDLPCSVAETTNDQGAGGLVRAEHGCSTGTYCGNVCFVADDGRDLDEVLDIHPRRTKLCLQVAPRKDCLGFGIIRYAAIGFHAYLSANVECAAGPAYFDGLRILASRSRGIGALCSRRCIWNAPLSEPYISGVYSGIRTLRPTTRPQVLAEALDRS
jgi:hypothetical protein